jgi:hypothetical protein
LLVVSCTVLAPSGVAYAQANPPPLDHFRCYPLLEGPQPDVLQALLQDQFDLFLGLALPNDAPLLAYFVGPPNRFCNPVEKTVEQHGALVTTPIGDPDAHLTLYRIFRQAVSAPALLAVPAVTWKVRVRNQFGEQKLDATRPVALAVPTWKHEANLEFPADLDHFKCYEARGKSVRREAQLEDQFESARVAVLSPRLFCNPTRKLVGAESTGIQHATQHLVCYDLRLIPDANDIVVTLEPRVISNQFTPDATILAVTDEDLLCVPTQKLAFSPDRSGQGGGGGDDDDDDQGEDD